MTTKVVRSPNYPAISLDEAVMRAKSVYDKEHAFPAPREAIAKDLGYGGLNGASLGIISALTKYGLLEPAGADQLKVSASARDILMHHKGEPERSVAIRTAALRPALFNELYSLYGDTLPSEHTLSVYLQKKNFNPKTVGGVIRCYRDTMEFVKAETEDSDTEYVDESEDEAPMQAPAVRSDGDRGQGPRIVAPLAEASGDRASQELRFKLVGDAEVRALFQGHITQDAIEMFKELLEISKRGFPKEAAPQGQDADDGDGQFAR